MAALFQRKLGRSAAATWSLIPVCLIMLLGSQAKGQSEIDDELARQDTVETRVPGRQAVQGSEALAAERDRVAALTRQLDAALADLEAAKGELAQAHELAIRERARSAVLHQNFLTLRKEIDALKDSVETAGETREESLRRELAAARKELEDMRRVETNASMQPGADADLMAMQGRALQEERERAEGLDGDLTLAQGEIERLKAEAVRARDAAEAFLTETRRALDQERRRVGRLEHDLAEARQSAEALEAKLAATAQAAAVQDLQSAEAAAKRAGEGLARERERADSAARDLELALRERDAAREELTRLSAALNEALDRERGKASDLARDLAAARKEIDALKADGKRRTSRLEPAPKAKATVHAKARANAPPRKVARSKRKSGLQEVRNVEVRKPWRSVRLMTLKLPDALLPRRPAMHASR